MSEPIPLGRPFLTEEEKRAVELVLDSGWIVQGPRVAQFEQALADYLGVKHVVCVASGTAAIELTLIASLVQGGEVITADFGFPSTGIAILHAGATPVLCDVDYYTYTITPADMEKLITDKTNAVLIVQPFGYPCDMDAIHDVLKKHPKIMLFEDAAGALGSKYMGKKVGTFGLASFFSFHGSKTLVTGEGGCMATNDVDLARRVACLRDHGSISYGQSKPKRFRAPGFNYRMTDIEAAIGLVQLEKLDDMIGERRNKAGYYTDKIKETIIPADVTKTPEEARASNIISFPYEMEGYYHTYQRYVCFIEKTGLRDKIMGELAKQGIETTFGYYSLGSQPVLSSYRGKCPRSRKCHERTLALPLYHTMTTEQQDRVISALAKLL